MTFLRSLAITAVGLALGALMPTVADAYPAYTSGSLNVRVGPGVGYPKITTLSPGAPVDVHYCQPSWCEIGFWGGSGWVSASYLVTGAPRFDRRFYARRVPTEPYIQLYFGPRRAWPGPGPFPGPFPNPWWW